MMGLIRKSLKIPVSLWGGVLRSGEPGVSFLIYHKVTGELPLELDMPFGLFERQMRYLAGTGAVITYAEAVELLVSGGPPPGDRYVITFDDGYRDFYTHAYPLLKELSLPAVVYVTTGFVEEGTPYQLSSRDGQSPKPLTWEMLGEMAASGLVTVGAHTHTHPVLRGEETGRIRDEVKRSNGLFDERLGFVPETFAYPKGRWSSGADQIVREHYSSAVLGGGARARADGFSPYKVPRVPVRRSDGWFFFKLKMRGFMEPEERLYEALRGLSGR